MVFFDLPKVLDHGNMVETRLASSLSYVATNTSPASWSGSLGADIVLLVAFGTDDNTAQQQNHDNPAPFYLLIRAPFSADYPITRAETEESRRNLNIYGPGAMEPVQSYRFRIVVFDCCIVVRPVET